MACVSKNNDREAAQCLYSTSPVNKTELASTLNGVAFDEMRENEDDQISDRDKSDDAGVLQRI